MGQVDRQLRQAVPSCANQILGGGHACSLETLVSYHLYLIYLCLPQLKVPSQILDEQHINHLAKQ